MRIKIWANSDPNTSSIGPYKNLDTIERETPYVVGDVTHYGEVITIPPPIEPFTEDVDQSVIVKLNPASLATKPDESVFEKPPTSYNKIEFFPIEVDLAGYLSSEPPPIGTHVIMAHENLTIEDMAPLIAPDTFSLWATDCFLSKDTIKALRSIRYAVAHRYSSPSNYNTGPDKHADDIVNFAVSCLALIRPTRRSRASNIVGVIKPDGMLDPHQFGTTHDPAEVPEIQKFFTIRTQDIDLLRTILPEFIQLYEKDDQGRVKDQYEPLRMAVHLYGEAYALHYWKARHILWWSAIEAIYGNNQDAAMARIYALFGNNALVDGYRCPIYEKGDIPSCYPPDPKNVHTLGEMVPRIYEVRNASAHGQKVPDSYFSAVSHPFGQTNGIDVLAEAATFIIRKTVIEIFRRGWRDKFKDRKTREEFWLYQYGLDKKQSLKRLKEMEDILKTPSG